MTSKLAIGVALGVAGFGACAQAAEAQTYSRTSVNQDTTSGSALTTQSSKSRQTGWYAGGVIGNLAIEDGGGDNAHLGAVGARIGFAPIRQLAFEVEGAVGVIGQTYIVGASEVDVELDSAFGAFVLGRIPVSDSFLVFGRVGVASAQLNVPSPFIPLTDEQSTGVGAGIGLEWATSGPTFRADVTGYDFDGAPAGQASLSILARF